MPSTRRIIRAFLASPGDLQEERRAIRGVVEEFNETWANELGYQVELIGWEETVAGYGRPQRLINQDVDRCDLFLGMIWRRWGTPPDHNGEFTSGFQEEFTRSMDRCRRTGSPEISLFFKSIPDEFLGDPGDDLKRVLEFRKTIIEGKELLFQDFSTVREIESQVRKSVSVYVNRIRAEDERSERGDFLVKRSEQRMRKDGEGIVEPKLSPLSSEGFRFLEDFVERIGKSNSLDALNAADIARFRLLGDLITRPGNEEMSLGVHDLNILFTARIEGLVLGNMEIGHLARMGFQHLVNENVPLWCWYSDLSQLGHEVAVVSSCGGANDNEKAGAITALTALGRDLPTAGLLHRDLVIASWFNEGSSVRVRTAALGYLSKCGVSADVEVAQAEYDRSDHATSRSALECIVGILLRTGQMNAAQQVVLESQFEALDANLLHSVLESFESLDVTGLLLGLEHRNPSIRLHALRTLRNQHRVTTVMADRLSADGDALVRREAVEALLALGEPLVEDDIRNILVRPRKRSGSLLGGAVAPDKSGEEVFDEYRSAMFRKLPEAELIRRVSESSIYDDSAYFALMEKYFDNHAAQLRRDVDDRFECYFNERIRRMSEGFDGFAQDSDFVKSARNLEQFLRRILTRKGLNALCMARMPEDLRRIRTNLQDRFVEGSTHDAEYLSRHGEWSDASLLANAEQPPLGAAMLMMGPDREFEHGVARAIISMGGRHPIEDVFALDMPATILQKTIELTAESRFSEISESALLTLFNHESEGVRKAAALQVVRALPKERIQAILREYVRGETTRYYNVVHWLDLGASMSQADAEEVARSAVN